MSHAFISYCHADKLVVNRLSDELERAGHTTWRDTKDLYVGARWRPAIRQAIKDGIAFIACFSTAFSQRDKSYMHAELNLAIEELTNFPRHRVWFIPVRIDDCEVPDISIGGGENLSDLQRIDLFTDFSDSVRKISKALTKADPYSKKKIHSVAENAFSRIKLTTLRDSSITAAAVKILFSRANGVPTASLDVGGNFDIENADVVGSSNRLVSDYSENLTGLSEQLAASLEKHGTIYSSRIASLPDRSNSEEIARIVSDIFDSLSG